MQNSILKYYGLCDTDLARCQNIQLDSKAFSEMEIAKKLDHIKECEFILIISIKAVTIIERRMPVDQLLKNKYNLYCTAIYERQEREFDGIKRSCAILVSKNQIVPLAKILFDFSSYAFSISNSHPSTFKLVKRMIEEFNYGPLTSPILGVCCKTALANDSIFFHILKGYDGNSVNIFYPQ